jgi:hypothetical protein
LDSLNVLVSKQSVRVVRRNRRLMTEATPFLPSLSPFGRKLLTAERDAGNLTSSGGLIVLRESAQRSEVAAVVADAVPDRRNPLLVTHSYRAMVTARMRAIAAGYEDADDLDALRFDPALVLACNREPEGGHGIPSQPTVSRLENGAGTDVAIDNPIARGLLNRICSQFPAVADKVARIRSRREGEPSSISAEAR